MAEKNGNWVYEIDSNLPAEVRYVLGERFEETKQKVLVCIGINPSTATPEQLDATLNRIQKYAKETGKYGAWYMLNIYPQRATNPNNMDKEINNDIHLKNLKQIQNLMNSLQSADIWCAWGSNITKRNYLKNCLRDIIDCIQKINNKSFRYVSRKATDREKHPKHPIHPIASIKTEKELAVFDLEGYLKTI